jgi:hypothetical protein
MPNCSRKFTDRYTHMSPNTHPTWTPMKPTRLQFTVSVCLETLLVLALVAVTVIVALLIAAPM